MTEHVVTHAGTNTRFRVDESASLADMRSWCPGFFRSPLGEREAYLIHRGQLIVRATLRHSNGSTERRTVVYLYVKESLDDPQHTVPDLCWAGWPRNIRYAKRWIDEILDTGRLDWWGRKEGSS